MTYDSIRGRIVLFRNGFTWEWDGEKWGFIVQNDSLRRDNFGMAFDRDRGRTVVNGGNDGFPKNDVIEWDGTQWIIALASGTGKPTDRPDARFRHTMSYDAARKETLLFGGSTNAPMNDTWGWNGTKWTEKAPLNSPGPRYHQGMEYDDARQLIVLFGGYDGTTVFGDTWFWNGTDWDKFGGISPPARYQHKMVWNEGRQTIVMTGGTNGTTPFNDTWEWDGTLWTKLGEGDYNGRAGHGLALDVRGFLVMFGGTVGGTAVDETWEWYGPEDLCLYTDNGTCECIGDDNCDDGDSCTDNICDTTSNSCRFVDNGTCGGGCSVKADCEDFNPCTDVICNPDGTCSNPDNGLCECFSDADCLGDGDSCTTTSCNLDTFLCSTVDNGSCEGFCTVDADCADDGNSCTTARCVENTCNQVSNGTCLECIPECEGISGYLDLAWPGTSGEVLAIAEDATHVYIGGTFSFVGQRAGLNAAYELTSENMVAGWPSIIGDRVETAVSDGLGGFFVGGVFWEVGGQPRTQLARIRADGTVHPWNPVINGNSVDAMIVHNGVLYVGGSFEAVNGAARANVAAFDVGTGALLSWAPVVNGPVLAMAAHEGDIFLGGSFSMVNGGSTPYVAAVDATGLSLPWNWGTVNGIVYALTVADGRVLYVGGAMTTPSVGVVAYDIVSRARVSWDPQVSGGNVRALQASGTTVYVGGAFTAAGGATRARLAAFDVDSGALLPWAPAVTGTDVRTLQLHGSRVLAGGWFNSVGGFNRSNAAVIDGTNGAVLPGGKLGTNRYMHVFASDGIRLFAGGEFDWAGGEVRGNLAAIEKGSGRVSDWDARPNGAVHGLATHGSTLYVGGVFTSVTNCTALECTPTARARLMSYTMPEGTMTTFDGAVDGPVYAVHVREPRLYIGGSFTTGGIVHNARAYELSSHSQVGWTPALGGIVRAITSTDTILYLAGERGLKTTGNTANHRHCLIAYDIPVSQAYREIQKNCPGATDQYLAVHIAGGNLYVGGMFTNFGADLRSNLASMNLSTFATTAWNPGPNGIVHGLASSATKVYAAGRFTQIAEQNRGRLAAFDSTTGALADWNPNVPEAGERIIAAIVGGDRLYVGGGFTRIEQFNRTNMAAFNTLEERCNVCPPASCSVDADCDDGDSCTDNGCHLTLGICLAPADNGSCEPACTVNADCEDFNPCTDVICNPDGTCSNPDNGLCECFSDADCLGEDFDPCTDNTCDLATNRCESVDNGTCPGTCTVDSDCNDGNTCTDNICAKGWTELVTPGPSPRGFPMMAYETSRQRTLLFGGVNATTYFNDTWIWNGTDWKESLVPGPTPRWGSAMAYDAKRDRVVLFGGEYNGAFLGDTWEWDGVSWTQRLVAGGPSPRWVHGMTYDETLEQIVLFGGAGADEIPLNDTWLWDGATWVSIAAPAPPARVNPELVYDKVRGRTLLFGGRAGGTLYSDTWEWNGTAWIQLVVAGPSPRWGHRMAYDSTRSRAVLFGGWNGAMHLSDTWEWDGTRWEQVSANGPSARQEPGMVYDAARGETVIFGGVGDDWWSDTWAWSGEPGGCVAIDNGTCCSLNADCDDSNACTSNLCHADGTCSNPDNGLCECQLDGDCDDGDPCTDNVCWTDWLVVEVDGPVDAWETAVYDAARGVTVVFAGYNTNWEEPGHTWEWDGASWKLVSEQGPDTRYGHSMAYDRDREVVMLFGGYDYDNRYRTDTWEWNGVTWTELAPTGPGVGYGSTMAYDEARREMIVFGGNQGGGRTLRWEGTNWLEVSNTGPSSRYQHGMVYDPVREESIVFGGRTGSGNFGDTWAWNGVNWRLVASEAEGPGPRYGHAMYFDRTRGVTVVHGGRDPSHTPQSDIWEWNGSRWIEVASETSQAKAFHAMAFDEGLDLAMLAYYGETALLTFPTRCLFQDNGTCLVPECVTDDDCNDGNSCTASACDLGTNTCVNTALTTGTTCGDFAQIESGGSHNCALSASGLLQCWGRDEFGQVSGAPSGVFQQVSGGAFFNCALFDDGTLTCWGSDEDGQVSGAPSGTFQQVSAGDNHACALRADNSISCWGDDGDFGQVSGTPSGAFKQVSAGSSNTCAIAMDDSISCWGVGFPNDSTPPAGQFQQISLGSQFGCALSNLGSVVCWGSNFFGETSSPPGTFIQISAGQSQSCAVAADGTAQCWGRDNDGQVSGLPPGSYAYVSSGQFHSCALTTDNEAVCWGDDSYGQAIAPAPATGFCDAGACQECLDDTHCSQDGNSCTTPICDLVTNTCTTVDNGTCECQTDLECDDGSTCTTNSCASHVRFIGATSQVNGGASITIAGPDGMEEGDLLLAVITRGGDLSEITAPAGWTLAWTLTNDEGSSIRTSVFSKFAGATEPLNYTFGFGTIDSNGGAIAVFRGVDLAQPFGAFAANGGRDSVFTAPSVSVVKDGLLVSAFTQADRDLNTIPTGMTMMWGAHTTDENNVSTSGAFEVIEADGLSGTRTSTSGRTDDWIALNLVLNPAGQKFCVALDNGTCTTCSLDFECDDGDICTTGRCDAGTCIQDPSGDLCCGVVCPVGWVCFGGACFPSEDEDVDYLDLFIDSSGNTEVDPLIPTQVTTTLPRITNTSEVFRADFISITLQIPGDSEKRGIFYEAIGSDIWVSTRPSAYNSEADLSARNVPQSQGGDWISCISSGFFGACVGDDPVPGACDLTCTRNRLLYLGINPADVTEVRFNPMSLAPLATDDSMALSWELDRNARPSIDGSTYAPNDMTRSSVGLASFLRYSDQNFNVIEREGPSVNWELDRSSIPDTFRACHDANNQVVNVGDTVSLWITSSCTTPTTGFRNIGGFDNVWGPIDVHTTLPEGFDYDNSSFFPGEPYRPRVLEVYHGGTTAPWSGGIAHIYNPMTRELQVTLEPNNVDKVLFPADRDWAAGEIVGYYIELQGQVLITAPADMRTTNTYATMDFEDGMAVRYTAQLGPSLATEAHYIVTPPECLVATDCPAGNACQEAVCNPNYTCGLIEICECAIDADCDDGNVCTTDVCEADGVCSNVGIVNCYAPCAGKQAGDLCNPCDPTDPFCVPPTNVSYCEEDGTCVESDPTSCNSDDQCDLSGDPCIVVACNLSTNLCETTVFCGDCGSDIECDDNNSCTTNTCDLTIFTCSTVNNGSCQCQANWECDDGNSCTTNTCDLGTNTCATADNGTCVEDCTSDIECDDLNPCTNNVCGGGWIDFPVASEPFLIPHRHGMGMAYDSSRGLLMLYGGNDATPLQDTWSFDGTTWRQLATTGPPHSIRGGMVYDARRDVLVYFGGYDDVTVSGDTWEWDGASWSRVAETGPAPREWFGMVYDANREVTVLHGGWNRAGTRFEDTWEWDGVSWTERPVSGPSARAEYAMAYDSARGVVLFFGGYDVISPYLGDTWEWDGTSWERVATTGPSPRRWTKMAFDSTRGVMVMTGGEDALGYVEDTWEWDGTSWTEVVGSGAQTWADHGMVYMEALGEMVTFGGWTLWDYKTWKYSGPPGGCVAIDNGTCECQSDLDCNDGNTCTDNTCDLTTNTCAPAVWNDTCACTLDTDCEDGNACTTGNCNTDGSCSYPDNNTCGCTLDTECDDGDPCTTSICALDGTCGTIWNGSCVCLLDADCEDENPCTDNLCNADGTCSNPDNGTCVATCTLDTECPLGSACYDGECKDNACQGVTCDVDFTCYGGTCFPQCLDDDDCDPDSVCYDGRCAPLDDSCLGVTCSASELCYGGTCFPSCTEDLDCDPDSVCYDGRCVVEVCVGELCEPDYCGGVLCGSEWTCFFGTCFPECTLDEQCDPGSVCYDGRCATDACVGVECEVDSTCWGGSCFPLCSEDGDCDDPESFCYEGRCAPEACHDVSCGTEEACYGGTCFPVCMEDADCDPNHVCYDGRCAPALDSCTGVQCSSVEVCYGGSCFATCEDSTTCDPDHVCYGGRCILEECDGDVCTPIYCDGVQCGTESICFWGTCFFECNSTSCDPASECYSGRCTDDPCEAVNCAGEQTCYQGTCFPVCSDDDDCDPNSYCYNGRCAPNACYGVDCPVGQECYQGTCFVGCSEDADCTETNEYCFNERCAVNPCDGVVCREGYDCVEGTCFMPCGPDGACDPDHHCYQGYCAQDNCNLPEQVRCHAGQTCYRGTCFYDCVDDDACDPNSFCYDGRCATDSCAALVTDYDSTASPHFYREVGGGYWPTLAQRSMPWRRPRPMSYAGTAATAMSAMLGGDLPAPNRARVVLYYEQASNRYALLLLHGAPVAAQGPIGATYSIRYGDVATAPAIAWRTGSQVYDVSRNDAFHHQEVHMQTNGGTSDGVAAVLLGYFPVNQKWTVRLSAAFRSGIDHWEFYSAETGEWLDLDLREEMELTNGPIGPKVNLTEEVGVRECVPQQPDGSTVEGICSRGTVTTCRYGSLACTQTVAPWNYEVCDGRDTNCDGAVDNVDADFGLRVPMVYVRQGGDSNPWLRTPTVDRAGPAFNQLNYTPVDGSSYGVGSTAIPSVETGDPIQDAMRSLTFFHRDLDQGILTMPLAHGARVQGAYPESSAVGAEFSFANDVASGDYDYADLLFNAWHDDWAADGVSSMTYDELRMNWNVERIDVEGSPGREADSALLQLVWQNGGNWQPIRFALAVDLPTSFNEWRLYRPHTALYALDPSKPLEVKVEWVPIEDSMCMSDTEFDGCRAVPYVCSDGALVCPAATEETCAGCRDRDGDGHLEYHPEHCPEGTDCDDGSPNVYPGAVERCDGADTNCDGFIDAIGPSSIGESCPNGEELCGPSECDHRMICACTDGDCYCRGGLEEDEEVEYTSGQRATWLNP